MDKYDSASTKLLMQIMAAEARHPKPSELPLQRFPSWKAPSVTFNGQSAVEVGWTRSWGLVKFVDSSGEERMEWVAAGLIKRLGG